MAKLKLTDQDAKRILSNAPSDKVFWVNNGPALRSLAEFANAAKKLTANQFAHHANSAKNDFAKWVSEVIGDSQLAKKLRQIKTRDDLVNVLANRLKQLQKTLKC